VQIFSTLAANKVDMALREACRRRKGGDHQAKGEDAQGRGSCFPGWCDDHSEREREREGKRVEQPVDAMILATRMHDHRTLLALVHKLFCAFLLMPMLHVYARSTSWN